MTTEEIKQLIQGSGIDEGEFQAEYNTQKKVSDEALADKKREIAKDEADLANKQAATAEILRKTKDWAKMDDYQKATLAQTGIRDANTFKTAQAKLTEKDDIMNKEQLAQAIRPMLVSQAFKSMDKKQKKDYILSQGGDPADFGF